MTGTPPGLAEQQTAFESGDHVPDSIPTGVYLDQKTLDAIGRRGRFWLERHKQALEQCPVGTVVIVDVIGGELVIAPTEQEADELYRMRCGISRPSYLTRIGRPITVGGGWWPQR